MSSTDFNFHTVENFLVVDLYLILGRDGYKEFWLLISWLRIWICNLGDAGVEHVVGSWFSFLVDVGQHVLVSIDNFLTIVASCSLVIIGERRIGNTFQMGDQYGGLENVVGNFSFMW